MLITASDYVAAKALEAKVLHACPPCELVHTPTSCPTPNADIQTHAANPAVGTQNILDRLDLVQEDSTARFEAVQRDLAAMQHDMNTRMTAMQRGMNNRLDSLQRDMNDLRRDMNERFDALDAHIDELQTVIAKVGPC
jgi:Skp family chaperone for outer membrane proteins